MAKNLSVLGSQSGKVGNIVFRKTKYGTIVSQLRGSNQSWFRSSSDAVRVRENSQEFSGLIRLSNSLKNALRPLPVFDKGNFIPRVSRVLAPLKNLDTSGDRGKRTYGIAENTALLRGFTVGVNSVASALPIAFSASRSGATVTFTTPAFTPNEVIKAPVGATHFRLFYMVASVSSLVWSDNENGYAPSNVQADMKSGMSFSSVIALNSEAQTATTTAVSSPVAALDGAGLFAVIGIMFYQQIGGVNYALTEGQGATILDGWDGGNE